MTGRKPLIRTSSLTDAAHIVGNIHDWTSCPPEGQNSFGGWIHEGEGRVKIAQGWRKLGLLLIETGVITRDGDFYRVRVRLTDSMNHHLTRCTEVKSTFTGNMCKPAKVEWDEERGEFVYFDRATAWRRAAFVYRRLRGDWPSTPSVLLDAGMI